jgi:hypothetical protein
MTAADAADVLAARRAERDALLARAVAGLRADPRVAGAWLLGSLGRGDGDALSDIDLCVVVRDADVAAVLAERRAFVARAGPPLLLLDVPRNAPPGGAYLLVLYPGAAGPLHVDWYWRPRTGTVVPHDGRVLLDRVGLPVAAPPAPPTDAARAAAATQDAVFFWAMAPIAAKYIARGWPEAGRDLLRLMAQALDRVLAYAAPAAPRGPPGRRRRGLPGRPRGQLAALRAMAREMAGLTPRLPLLGGSVHPDTLPQLACFFDTVEMLIRPEAAPGGAAPSPPVGRPG